MLQSLFEQLAGKVALILCELTEKFPRICRSYLKLYMGEFEFMCLTFIGLYFAFYLLKRNRAYIICILLFIQKHFCHLK